MKDKATLLAEYEQKLTSATKYYTEGMALAKQKFDTLVAYYEQQKTTSEQNAKRIYETSIAKLDAREVKKETKPKKTSDPEAFLKKIPEKKRHSILQAAGKNYGRDTVLKDYTDEQVSILKKQWEKENQEDLKEIEQAEEVIEQKKEKEVIVLHNSIGSLLFGGQIEPEPEPEPEEEQEEQEEEEEDSSDEEYKNSEEYKESRRKHDEMMQKVREKLAEKERLKQEKQKEEECQKQKELSSSSSLETSSSTSSTTGTNTIPALSEDMLVALKDDDPFAELRKKAQEEDKPKKMNLINLSNFNKVKQQPQLIEPEPEQQRPNLISNTKVKKPVKTVPKRF